MSLKNFFEQHLQLHTLRIELKSGRVLRYPIDPRRKQELEEWMRNPADPFSSLISSFLSFYSDYDRMVFIRISAVNRFTFLWDPVHSAIDVGAYSDPFNIINNDTKEDTFIDAEKQVDEVKETPQWLKNLDLDEIPEDYTFHADNDDLQDAEFENFEGPDIPDAIVLVDNEQEPYLYYSLDEEQDYIQINNKTGFNSVALEGRFISFADENGEENYIPVENIVCLDVSRRLVYNDQEWEEIERKWMLDNNTN